MQRERFTIKNEPKVEIDKRVAIYTEKMVTDVILVSFLKDKGFIRLTLGYYYLGTIIQLISEDMSLMTNNITDLRDVVGYCYGSTGSRVDRAIKHVIMPIPEFKKMKQKDIINKLVGEYLIVKKESKRRVRKW